MDSVELIQCDTDIDPKDPRLADHIEEPRIFRIYISVTFDVICIKKYFLQDFGHEKFNYIMPLQVKKCIMTKWMKWNPLMKTDERVDLYRLLLTNNIMGKFNYGIYEEEFKEHFKIL